MCGRSATRTLQQRQLHNLFSIGQGKRIGLQANVVHAEARQAFWSRALHKDARNSSTDKARSLCAFQDQKDGQRVVSPWNVANAITVGRLVVTPFTGYLILSGQYGAALGTVAFAGTSDWLDGYLARRYKLQTVLGSYLDPMADKLLVTTVTLSLAAQSVFSPWLAAVIVGRDVLLIMGALALRARTVERWSHLLRVQTVSPIAIEPLPISKANTAMQLTLSVCGIVSAGDWGMVSPDALNVIGLATACTTTASGLSYAYQASTKLGARRRKMSAKD